VNTGSKTDNTGYYEVKARPGAREIMAFTFNNGLSMEYIYRRNSIDLILPRVPLCRNQPSVKAMPKKRPPGNGAP
jgi:hypothetical protein